jgi:hypothetical protein
MKKFLVSAGLVLAGAASLQAAYAPDVNAASDTSKMWSIAGTLRGFYDDNYTTSGDGRGSYSFEVSPQISVNIPLTQTEFGARYTYGLYYYQDRQQLGQDPIDQSHQLDLWLDHTFTERWQARVTDTLAVGQEPELLNPSSSPSSLPFRVNGNNLVNTASFSLTTDWTREFSTVIGYQNTFYDYENSGATVINEIPPNSPLSPGFEELAGNGASLAGTLNRLEHLLHIDFQWHATPMTTFLVGYQYGQVNYTGNEPIGVYNYFTPIVTFPFSEGHTVTYYSNSRDNRSHYVYVGTQSSLTPNLSVAANVGVQYNDNYNNPLQETTSLSPYAVASMTYTYLPGCYAQIGVTHSLNATDVIAINQANGSITENQESTVVYGDINHKITEKLFATLIANYQLSSFDGGQYSSESDNEYNLGVNFNYTFTRHFSGEVGYNYDNLTSDIPGRSYSRNRVYVGVTATY